MGEANFTSVRGPLREADLYVSPAAGVARPLVQSRSKVRILLVCSSPRKSQMLARSFQGPEFQLSEVNTTLEALLQIQAVPVDIALVDSEDPEIDGLQLCRMIALREGQCPRVFLVSTKLCAEEEIAAIEAGAEGVLLLPFDDRLVHARIAAVLRNPSASAAATETASVLFTLAQFVEERDESLGAHCQRLSSITALVGVSLGLTGSDILTLQRASYLHDVGKIGIPDRVLFKPGPLTPGEWDVMKTHAERGEKLCSSVRSLAPVLPLIRHHHERWDGSGYPDGLKGQEIPMLARILQLADIYDALTAERPYKRAFTSTEALEILHSETVKGWRDPELVRSFAKIVPLFDKDASAETSGISLCSLSASLHKQEGSFADPRMLEDAEVLGGL